MKETRKERERKNISEQNRAKHSVIYDIQIQQGFIVIISAGLPFPIFPDIKEKEGRGKGGIKEGDYMGEKRGGGDDDN